MNDIPLDDLLACAVDAVQTATGHAMANLGRRRDMVQLARHDVKLVLDLECQEKAEAVIRRHFPEHDTLGEEDPSALEARAASDGYEWVIDPIDGTVNFSHGLPIWGCSIAVRHGDQTLAGAVLAPELDLLYTATGDSPAMCNGRAIHVSQTPSLAEAMVLTGMDKSLHADAPPFAILSAIASAVQRPRILGSASLDLCRVAAGEGDGYFESGIYIWDIIAAGLIVRQAGGQAEIIGDQGDGCLLYVGSNGLVHEELKGLVLGAIEENSTPNIQHGISNIQGF